MSFQLSPRERAPACSPSSASRDSCCVSTSMLGVRECGQARSLAQRDWVNESQAARVRRRHAARSPIRASRRSCCQGSGFGVSSPRVRHHAIQAGGGSASDARRIHVERLRENLADFDEKLSRTLVNRVLESFRWTGFMSRPGTKFLEFLKCFSRNRPSFPATALHVPGVSAACSPSRASDDSCCQGSGFRV